MRIPTDRLSLEGGTIEALEAELQGRAALSKSLGVAIPADWPPLFYDADAIRWTLNALRERRAASEDDGYGFYYFIAAIDGHSVAVGVGGFKGPPVDGVVEVGYSVMPEFQKRGYATEAVNGFLRHAFSDPAITAVIAETLPDLTGSIRVLEKSGFTLTGAGSEEGVIRFRIPRSEFKAW